MSYPYSTLCPTAAAGGPDSLGSSGLGEFQHGQVLTPSVDATMHSSAGGGMSATHTGSDSMAVNYTPVVIDYDHGRMGSVLSLDSMFAHPATHPHPNSSHYHRHVHSHSFDTPANCLQNGPPSLVPSFQNAMPQDMGYVHGYEPTYAPLMSSTPSPIIGLNTANSDFNNGGCYAPLVNVAAQPDFSQMRGTNIFPGVNFTNTGHGSASTHYPNSSSSFLCPTWPPANNHMQEISAITVNSCSSASNGHGVVDNNMPPPPSMELNDLVQRLNPVMDTPMEISHNGGPDEQSLTDIEQIVYKVSNYYS